MAETYGAFRIDGLRGTLELLESLPAEVVSKRGGPVLAALRKGGRVILERERAILRRVTANATESGERESTGLLLASLRVKRGKPPAGSKGERVIVGPRRVRYQRKGETVTTLKTGHLLEYGSIDQPAESWVRAAFAETAQLATDTTVAELGRAIDRAIARYNRRK